MLPIYNFSKIGQGIFEKPASLAFIQRPTKHAPDVWESARFTSIFLALSFFYISSLFLPRPHAGNANRWAAVQMAYHKNKK
jgi:hypothetical protein